MTSLRVRPLDELVTILVSEHTGMKKLLDEARNAVLGGNFTVAKEALAEVDRTFKQHVADEEGQILRLLLETYGKEGSEDAIRVFRQHRPIYKLIEAVENFTRLSAEELSRNGDDLRKLLDEHTNSEELRVFPRSLEAQRVRGSSLSKASP